MKANLIVKLAVLGALLVPGFASAVSLHPDTFLKTDGLVCGLIANVNSHYGQVEQKEGSDYTIRIDCDMDQSKDDLAKEPIAVLDHLDATRAYWVRQYNADKVTSAAKLFDPEYRSDLPYVCFTNAKITFDPCAQKSETRAHIRSFENMSAYPKKIKTWKNKEARGEKI
jgi:hypothetical protein